MICHKGLVIAAIGLSLLAGKVAAQQNSVTIRGGEHQSYSRLVIPTVNDLEWELRSSGRRTSLTLPTTQTIFLTERAFDRVPRSRLLDLSSETVGQSTVISLRLGCDCTVTAQIEGGSLVLDINDPDSKPKEATLAATENGSSRPLPRPTDTQETSSPDQMRPAQSFPTDLTERLISQLNRAAEQGIIQLNEPVATNPEKIEDPEPALATQTVLPELSPEPNLKPIEENLDGLGQVAERVEQELSDAFAQSGLSDSVRVTIPDETFLPPEPKKMVRNNSTEPPENELGLEDHCIEDEFLDIAYWADERDYSEQFSELQSRVFGEFDEPDTEAVLSLVRFFLYFGLATEAKTLIEDLKLEQRQAEILREVAITVEGKPYLAGGILDLAAGCPGAVALWRTAAIDEAEVQPTSNPNEIINTFSEYPIEVRRILGPRLVRSFLTRGQVSAANRVFAIVERAAGFHGNQHEFMRAELLERNGDKLSAEATYWRLVHETSEVSAKAAEKLVKSMLSRDVRVPENVVTVLEALAFEFRGSPEGADLLLASVIAKANSNKIADAIKTSLNEIDANPEEAARYYTAIRSMFDNIDVEDLGPVQFASLIFENIDLITGSNLSDENKIAVADEFMRAGLPNVTANILNTLSKPQNAQVTDLLAKAALKMDDPQSVLRITQTTTEPVLTSLRSRALSRIGRHDEALNSLNKDQSSLDRTRLAWRAGEWGTAVQSNDPPFQILSEFMLQRQDPKRPAQDADFTQTQTAMETTLAKNDDLTLKYAQDLRQQSTTIRRYLTGLMEDMGE